MMRRLPTLWRRLRGTFRDEPCDAEFQAEIEEHIRLLADRYRRQGMTADAAVSAARRQFGNVALLTEDRRRLRTLPALESVWTDLTYAARGLRRNRAFAAAAVTTLALGIGVNTAIFSVCDAVLFKPLPYAEPHRIVTLWERMRGGSPGTVAPANFVDWRSASRSFSAMAAVSSPSFILGGQNESARLAGAAVSSNFFSLLGVRLALGRGFLEEEDQPGKNRVVVLSDSLWRDRFGSDRAIVGRVITLNDESYTVIGVAPAGFRFGSAAADFSSEQPGRRLGADRTQSSEAAAGYAPAARHRAARTRSHAAGGPGRARHRGGQSGAALSR